MPYHVRITHRDASRQSRDTLGLDKDEAWIEQHVVRPRREGRETFIEGRVVQWDDVDELHVTYTDRPSAELIPLIAQRRRSESVVTTISDDWYVAYEGEEVTERFISGAPGSQTPTAGTHPSPAEDPAAVMVVHGQDAEATRALFDWLRSIGLHPKEWSQLLRATGTASPFIGQVLDEAFRLAQAVVVLFTPDERATLREELSGRAGHWRLQGRPNVLFEAGTAIATHPKQTVLVVLGDLELPSDLAGRHYVRLSGVSALRDLAQRLEDAGCPVDRSGDHWLDFGQFPDRSDVVSEPRLTAGDERAERRAGYRQLLMAHGGLVQAYVGEHIYDTTIVKARAAFDEAQSAVLIHGTPEARRAAEALRDAWAPRVHGRYMGQGWQDNVEAARQAFIRAATESA
jgi:predicted nucleotide-binding protein